MKHQPGCDGTNDTPTHHSPGLNASSRVTGPGRLGGRRGNDDARLLGQNAHPVEAVGRLVVEGPGVTRLRNAQAGLREELSQVKD